MPPSPPPQPTLAPVQNSAESAERRTISNIKFRFLTYDPFHVIPSLEEKERIIKGPIHHALSVILLHRPSVECINLISRFAYHPETLFSSQGLHTHPRKISISRTKIDRRVVSIMYERRMINTRLHLSPSSPPRYL